jgi:hypothetical protein
LKNSLVTRITFALPPGHYERVQTGLADATNDLSNALRHLESAQTIVELDPVGSYQLSYDAARKSIQAVLTSLGLRITSGGGLYAFVRVAESGIFESPAWLEFRTMRIVRNQVEYPESTTPVLDVKTLLYVIECGKHMQHEAAHLIDSLGSFHA